MHRLTRAALMTALLASPAPLSACGGSKKATEPTPGGASDSGTPSGDAGSEGTARGKDECVGPNLDDVLLKSACEEPVSPDALPPVDLKGVLGVTATSSPTKVAGAGKADILVTYVNKSKAPLVLHFRIDPVARFETETWTTGKTPKRADMPPGHAPAPPQGASPPAASEARSVRVTLAPSATAHARVVWEAVKTAWAPGKYLGTPPERGFPRAPAGPLARGKYTVKVATPLLAVSESELRVPAVEIEVGP